MFFKYPYTDLYNLNLDWLIQAVKEMQETVGPLARVVNSVNGMTGDVVIDETMLLSILGGMVKSFNGRTGAVQLTENDINQTMIDITWTSDPGDVIGDLSQTTLNELFQAGRRILIFINSRGEPDRIYFLLWASDHAIVQPYIPTGAIAGVASVNGASGAVTLTGANIPTVPGSSETIATAIGTLTLDVADKQDALTFDSTPTAGSDNPVTSGGVQAALAGKQNTLTFDNSPTVGSNNPVKSGGIASALATRQPMLTFDNTPTLNSGNPVTSGGVKTALDAQKINIKTVTMQFTCAAGDSTMPVSQILAAGGIDSSKAINVRCNGVRALTSWSEVFAIFYYVENGNAYIFRNNGTGGQAEATFAIFYKP